MIKLLIFNFALIAAIAVGLWFVKKYVRTELSQGIVLLAAALFTIVFHYSSFILLLLSGGDAIEYLKETPNLILPIYPCNVVMWSALIFALLKNKRSKLANYFVDYLFWFGIFSTLVGMFANVDFIKNPTLSDYEVTKSIIAHATLLFNVMLIPTFGLLRTDFLRNMKNMVISVIGMYVIGLYCNLVLSALSSAEFAYYKNSMFISHSPFDGLPFLRYPVIAVAALIIYLMIFTVCDAVKSPRGSRWYDLAVAKLRKKDK